FRDVGLAEFPRFDCDEFLAKRPEKGALILGEAEQEAEEQDSHASTLHAGALGEVQSLGQRQNVQEVLSQVWVAVKRERRELSNPPLNLFGILAIRHGVLRPDQLRQLLEEQARDGSTPLGELARRRGILSARQVRRLLELQKTGSFDPDNTSFGG